MSDKAEGKRRLKREVIIAIVGLIVAGVYVIAIRVPPETTCRLVEGDGVPTLNCTILTHRDVSRGRRASRPRVTQFVDVSALNPSSMVNASMRLVIEQGYAAVNYRIEEGRWSSLRVDARNGDRNSSAWETAMTVTDNRVEFMIEAGSRSRVQLEVAFTNPVETVLDESAVTQTPYIIIVGDDENAATQEAYNSVMSDGDVTAVPREGFISVVGDGQEGFVSIVGGGDAATEMAETQQP